jgi:CRP-like cAMP-binding protein
LRRVFDGVIAGKPSYHPLMPASRTADFLKAGTVFAALPGLRDPTSWRAVAREQSISRSSDFIFREGDESALVLAGPHGAVKILRHKPRSGDEVVLELLGPGARSEVWRCSKAALPGIGSGHGGRAPSWVSAGAESVALAERHPTLAREVSLMLARRLRTAHDSVKSLASDPVEARLASRLISLPNAKARATLAASRCPFISRARRWPICAAPPSNPPSAFHEAAGAGRAS